MQEDLEDLALFIADKEVAGEILDVDEILGDDLRKGVTIREVHYDSKVVGEEPPL